MGTDYRSVFFTKSQSTVILEQYVENVCNLNNVSVEFSGNIQFAILETRELLFRLYSENEIKGIVLLAELKRNGLLFTLKTEPLFSQGLDPDEIERMAKKAMLEKNLFIVARLTDELKIMKNGNEVLLFFNWEGMRYERVIERISTLKEFWLKRKELKEV